MRNPDMRVNDSFRLNPHLRNKLVQLHKLVQPDAAFSGVRVEPPAAPFNAPDWGLEPREGRDGGEPDLLERKARRESILPLRDATLARSLPSIGRRGWRSAAEAALPLRQRPS